MLTIPFYMMLRNLVMNMYIHEPSTEVIQIMLEYLDEDTAYDVFHKCCDKQGVGANSFTFEHLPGILQDLVENQELVEDLSKVEKWAMFDRLADLSNQQNGQKIVLTLYRGGGR